MCDNNDAIHVDVEEFAAHMADIRADLMLNEQYISEEEKNYEDLYGNLKQGLYDNAFKCAQTLRRLHLSKYKDDIISCYKICSEHDVASAMFEMVSLSVDKRKMTVKPEAFPYLYRLSELGYVESFRWLADCYYYGIGCEADKSKANKSYFEDFLFNGSEYSKRKLRLLNPELEEYCGDDIIKKLMNRLVFGNNVYYYNAKVSAEVKIAEMILNGQIKDYSAETGYYILRNDVTEDGVAKLRLGECVLNGIGTMPNAFAALEVLEEAQFEIQWTLDRIDEEETMRELKYNFHDGYDYGQMLDRVNEMISEAQEQISRIRIDNSYLCYFDGCTSEDEVLEQWHDEKLTRIKRKDKSV